MITERLQAAIDREIAASPRARELLTQLEGRSLAIEARYTPRQVTLRATAGRLQIDRNAQDGASDARLAGTPFALAMLARENPSEVIRRGDVTLTGDGQVAERFQELVSLLKPDLEDSLSRIVGDVPAHAAGGLLRRVLGFGRDSADTLARNAGEYLVHERRTLVPRAEAQDFLEQVDELRERADRLEARVDALTRAQADRS
jgi:ubiquinone biosynthesis protein UbiJ